MKKTLIFLLLVSLVRVSFAVSTEYFYLSGTGLGDTRNWEIFCTEGGKSNYWDTIPVPSQWELHGFGNYTYGRWYKVPGVTHPSMEKAIYRTRFDLKPEWIGKNIRIVFDGVMTDAEVLINGKSAGDIHQGAFYRFSYDVTDKLKPEQPNELEVRVSKHSSNSSINAAERKADWWLFGGIYRPVYLEVKPESHIRTIGTDCRMGGDYRVNLSTTDLPAGWKVETELTAVKTGKRIGKIRFPLGAGTHHSISGSWKGVQEWTPETPVLYEMKLTLLDQAGKPVHSNRQRVGFRTIEFRPKDGLYLNGTKLVLKGINRHSFHPDGGRTTNKQISIEDARLIKEMNMNAVRFHYPPDKHFLDVCDSLGLLVMDELCGWQNGYDAKVAPKLLREMMERDINHPSIVLWSNGNEGGWSKSVDDLFAELDPQQRHMVHPWADYNELDTHHYPAFQTGIGRLINGYKVFLPTEFMHGMYDQGHGAGLEDFWDSYTAHPLFAGGFMWDFSDNAVRRSDRGGALDSDGSNASDGILGPYREKEASYHTVREVWAPIRFKPFFINSSFNGDLTLSNHYLFTDLKDCKLTYRILQNPIQGETGVCIEQGNIPLPSVLPGESRKLKMPVSGKLFSGDVLELIASHPDGSTMCNWTWPIHYAGAYFRNHYRPQPAHKTTVSQSDTLVTLSANGVSVSFSKNSGLLCDVRNRNKRISFADGPKPVGMKARFQQGYVQQKGDTLAFVARYLGGVDSIEWRMNPDGLVTMSAVMLNRATGGKGFDDAVTEKNITNFGFTFSYPEKQVTGMRWFGKGPYRVWKNRQKGMNYAVWEKDYNNTITGEYDEPLIYPEFKGYHANIYWLTLQNKESDFTVMSESDGLYVRVFTPEEPRHKLMEEATMPAFPEGDISFLYEIPGMRCFKPISEHGPKSQPGMVRIKSGDEGVKMLLHFDFRE